VQGLGVIDVEAVLEHHLPVAAVGEVGVAAHHFEPFRRLIDPGIDEYRGAAQVLVQRRHVRVQAGEEKAAVFLQPRHLRQIVAEAPKRLRIAAGGFIRHLQTRAGAVEHPAVVRTLVTLGVAGLGGGHGGAAVAAVVQQRPHLAISAALKNDRRAADDAGDEVVRLGYLRRVADEHPRALVDVAHLELEQLRVAEQVQMHAQHAVPGTGVDVAGKIPQRQFANTCVHSLLLI
jgi:hypothetical protein